MDGLASGYAFARTQAILLNARDSRVASQRVILLCVQIGLALVASLPLGVFALTALFQVKSLLDKSSEVCIITADTWGPLRRLRHTKGGGLWMSGLGGRARERRVRRLKNVCNILETFLKHP